MAHLLRTVPDSILVRGYVTTGADLAAIDQKTFLAINGDEGGSWSPSSPIVLGGAGVVIAGPWIMSTSGVSVVTGVSSPITFDRGTKGDYFGLAAGHPLRSPAVRTGFVDYFSAVAQSVAWFGGLLPAFPGARFFTPLNVFSGAPQVDSVDISFRVRDPRTTPPRGLPQYLPRVRVIAVDDEGTVIPLRTKDASTDADGFQFLPMPASVAAYYNGGVAQTWTYVCNVALPVDSGKHVYYIEFVDEDGTNAWDPHRMTAGAPDTLQNQYYSAIAHHSNVEVFDGRN